MKKAIAIVVFLAAVAGVLIYGYRSRSRKPVNFLLITIDTLRADHLGAYGYSRKLTPVLDRLAAGGILFENAFCVMPTTLPSHGSIFFSTWPRIHGSLSNFVRFSNGSLTFLPDLLQKAGYAVGAVVSVPHLGKNFEHYSSFHDIRFPDRDRSAEETLHTARAWLKSNGDQPFFLWIHLWDPHSPYELHPAYMDQIHPGFKNDFEKHYQFLKGYSYPPDLLQDMVDLYDNEIAYTDDQLGRFLDGFGRRKGAENTMILVLSDHGETLGELAQSEGYAFDHGEFLYDHQLRVPLIVVPPGAKERGLRISHTVSLLDVMPTILQTAGVPVPSSAQGNSLVPYLAGSTPARQDPLVFLERREFTTPPMPFLAQRQFGIRERNYKLLYNESDKQAFIYKNGNEGVEATGQDRLKDMMLKRMQEWLTMTAGLSKGTGQAVSEEEAEKLRSLGYVQ